MNVRRLVIGLAIPALVAGIALPVLGQADVPTISVQPVGTSELDPNQGAWFYSYLKPNESTTMQARLTNVADVAQTVRIYLADLDFSDTGAAHVADASTDLGTWGTIEPSTRRIGPQETVIVSFTLTAPAGAEPGDHVGVLVVESAPQQVEGSGVGVIKRVATRVYAAVPGAATQDVTIESVGIERDSAFFTREVTLTVALRNSGRIRLDPTVAINGVSAVGPATVLTRSVESYIATVPVPFWGGPQRYRVDVTTEVRGQQGPVRQLRASTFIIPWHLVPILALAAGLVYALRLAMRRRGGRYEALQADMRRIERLLSNQAAQASAPAASTGTADDPRTAIVAALKQARRSGNKDAEAKLKEQLEQTKALRNPSSPVTSDEPPPRPSVVESLTSDEPPAPSDAHAEGGDALRAILKEISNAPTERRSALIRAARSYGASELDRHPDLLESLPADVRVKLFASRPARRPTRKGRSDRRP